MNTTTNDKERQTPEWLKGIVAMGAHWEPLSFRRRGGFTSTDDERRYEFDHSEEMAKRLKAIGVNAAIYHGYKGLGFKYEKDEMEHTRRFAEHCRKHGIVLGTYCNMGSFFAETMFDENPEARAWPAADLHGLPHQYSEYYRCYYRYRPCMTHRGFWDYVERMALYLVNHVKTEWILFDNNAMMPCYCEHCHREYKAFVQRRYPTDTPEGRKRAEQRFGYAFLDHLTIPRGTARMPIDSLPACHDPGLQEWVAYRCGLVSEGYARLCRAVKAAKPEVGINLNPAFHYGEFSPLVWGNDVEAQSLYGDMMFSEDSNWPHVGPDGQLVGHFPSYKFGRATGQRMIVHQVEAEDFRRSILEAAVFNQGMLGQVLWMQKPIPGPDSPVATTLNFVHRHAGLYTNNDTLADVALLRGGSAMINNWAAAYQSKLMTYQVLMRYGFQHDLVLERHLPNLGKYRLLILPNTISLSDTSLAHIRRYVENGGAVIAIEQAGRCDDWGRVRNSASVTLDGERDSSLGGFRGQAGSRFAEILGVAGTAAQRVYELPELVHRKKFHWQVDRAWVAVIDHAFWHMPENHTDLAALIHKALGNRMLIAYDQPSYVVPQLLTYWEGWSLHLLNYDLKHPVGPMTVRVDLPIRRATSFTFEDETPRPVEIRMGPLDCELVLPAFDFYRCVVLEK